MIVVRGAIAAAVFVGGIIELTAGCAHRGASPSDVVRDFAVAIQQGEYERAYSLMSDTYRRQVPLSRFRGELEAERSTVAHDAALLLPGLSGPAARPARAEVETGAGDHVALIFQGGSWRLVEQPLSPFGQQSPRAALRTFVRAIGQRRYDVVLRLVPARHRSRVTEAKLRLYWEGPESGPNRRLLDLLRDNLDAPIIDLGTEAQMPYGKRGREGPHGQDARQDARQGALQDVNEPNDGEVRFLLEEGVWKIDDAG